MSRIGPKTKLVPGTRWPVAARRSEAFNRGYESGLQGYEVNPYSAEYPDDDLNECWRRGCDEGLLVRKGKNAGCLR